MQNGVLRNFKKFTGKHLCQSLFLRLFAVNFVKLQKKPFLQYTSERLLLNTNQTQIEKMKKKPYSKEKVNIRVTLYMLSKISLSTSEILIKIYEHLCSSVKKSWIQSLNNPTINYYKLLQGQKLYESAEEHNLFHPFIHNSEKWTHIL